jgi:hypothetical protein
MYKIQDLKTGIIYNSKAAYFKEKHSWVGSKIPSLMIDQYLAKHSTEYTFIEKIPQTVAGKYGYHGIKEVAKINNHVLVATDNIEFNIFLKQKSTEVAKMPSEYVKHVDTSKSNCRKIWELEDLDLRKECADFYTLYDLTIDHSDDAYLMSIYKEKRNYLAKQFANYLDMAVGGELRHCMNLSNFLKVVEKTQLRSGGRHEAWLEWKNIRNNRGIEATQTVSKR